jgi:exopolysaccharide biosynthesis polyprenyl glycosylphosphotransferase
MKPAWHSWWRTTAIALDSAAVALALTAAGLLRLGPLQNIDYASSELGATTLASQIALGIPLWIASLAAFSLYSPVRNLNAVEQARRLVAAGLAAPIALVSISFAFRQEPSRLWIALSTMLVIPAVALERRALSWFVSRRRERGKWQTPVVVVGRREAKALLEDLVMNPVRGMLPVATCGFAWDGLPEGNLNDLDHVVRSNGATTVVIVATDMERDEVNHVVAVADQLPAQVLILPGLDYTLAHNLAIVPVGDEPGLSLEPASLRNYQRLMKRSMDIVLSATALLVTFPALLAIGLMVRLNSPGPAIFKQPRLGMGGKIFTVWKFRTMVDGSDEDAELHVDRDDGWGFTVKAPDDPRVTTMGKWLRRMSLDELPQFVNVFRGDMSLVGPRPVTLREGSFSESVLGGRFLMPPGITGLWQVSGRHTLAAEDRARLDLTYVRNWSLLLDIYIILRTIPAILAKHGAY